MNKKNEGVTRQGACLESEKKAYKASSFKEGMKDGAPIALGYFAVAFTIGIAAKNAGLTASLGFLASILNNASAGQYAGFTVIAADSSYFEAAIVTLITNARYFLMSCALSQRFAPKTPLYHRLLIGYDVTDELFGLNIARQGYINPYYAYGAMAITIPCWAVGTALGVIAGNALPLRAVSALSVALFGMFLAVIIPPAQKDHKVGILVALSFTASFAISKLLPVLSAGTRTIILTLVIAGLGAFFFPRPEEDGEK